MKRTFLALAICFFVLVASKTLFVGKNQKAEMAPDSEKYSLIITGFGSKNIFGSWTGEVGPFMNSLNESSDVSAKVGICNTVSEGRIYGNKVLVAVSGMAKVKTTACLMEILQKYDSDIKEVIFVGIAGVSTSKGAMLGDVCINSQAFDFDLQHYSSDTLKSAAPAFWPQDSSFDAKYNQTKPDLAVEIKNASDKVTYPDSPANVNDINSLYHNNSRRAKAWELKECMEATSDLYWHDLKLDKKAREQAVVYLNKVYNEEISPEDVVIYTSMEALPAAAVVNWWNIAKNETIAFAYVRGAANFDHSYLNTDGSVALDATSSIKMFRDKKTSEYAIQTASLPVLKMFELRGENK